MLGAYKLQYENCRKFQRQRNVAVDVHVNLTSKWHLISNNSKFRFNLQYVNEGESFIKLQNRNRSEGYVKHQV